jgi:hypothetical protein
MLSIRQLGHGRSQQQQGRFERGTHDVKIGYSALDVGFAMLCWWGAGLLDL